MTGYTRRHVVTGCCASLGVLSGCNRSNDGAGGGGQPTDDGPTPQSETDAAAATAAEDERTTVEGDTTDSTESTDEAATPSDLDLREANVVDVEFESTGESEYRFDVSLYHDVRKSRSRFSQPIRNLRFLRTTTAKTATRTGGRSRRSAGSDSAVGNSCTLTRRLRSLAPRRSRSPPTSTAWSFAATTRPTATAGRR